MPSMTKAGYVPPVQPQKTPRKKRGGARKKRKAGRFSISAVLSVLVFFAACLIGAGTLYVYMETAPYANAFLPGTMLLGYPLDGASMEEARGLLDKVTSAEIEDFRVELKWENQSYILASSEVGLAVDMDATLAPLWQRGHEGGMLERFAEMLRLKQEPMIMRPIVTYDMAAADALLELIRQDIVCDAEDAQVVFTPGSAQPFAFSAESIGYSLDLTDVRMQIENALASIESASIELSPQTILPEITLEDLNGAIVLRSRVVMQIDPQEAAYTNAALAAKALNGARVETGQTLSFNDIVGVRSTARGYLAANEPAYGEGASGTGGGICQVSTGLYRLALLGGIPVKERSAAVYPVGYCEMGQEAAVSDQGIDLVIENPTQYPIFLAARTYRDDEQAFLELQLIGEPLEERYVLVSGILEETVVEEPVYVRDHEGKYAKYDDERVEAGEGKPGYMVVVDRVTIDAQGNELSREEISQDEYAPIPPAIYVGVQKRE